MIDRAFWSCQCAMCELKRREGEAEPQEVQIAIGNLLPNWFLDAMKDGRIVPTGAREGDLVWGHQGCDVNGPGGTFHVPLGGWLSRDRLL